MNAHRIQYSYVFRGKRWIVDEYGSFGCYSARSIVRPRILFHFFFSFGVCWDRRDDKRFNVVTHTRALYRQHMTRWIRTHFTIGILIFPHQCKIFASIFYCYQCPFLWRRCDGFTRHNLPYGFGVRVCGFLPHKRCEKMSLRHSLRALGVQKSSVHVWPYFVYFTYLEHARNTLKGKENRAQCDKGVDSGS